MRTGILLLLLLFQSASPFTDNSNGVGSSATSTVVVRTTLEEPMRNVTASRRPKTTTPTGQNLDAPKVKRKHRQKATASSSSTSTTNSDGLRRIRSEWKNVVEAGIGYHWRRGLPIQRHSQPSHMWLGPLDERNLYIWHFTLVGLQGSPYGNGLYHGRIVLPQSYPLQPPRVQMLTPSGRFVPRVDICLSASHYHPETWSPTHWSIRTLVEALRLHMVTPPLEIGGMPNVSYEQRQAYAQQSLQWKIHIPLSSGTVIIIDHERMMQQGLFDGILEASKSAVASGAVNVTVETEADLHTNPSVTAETTQKSKKKSKRSSRQSRSQSTPPRARTGAAVKALSSASRTTTVQVEPLGVRLVVTALRLVPLLVCLLLWKLVISWFLPS